MHTECAECAKGGKTRLVSIAVALIARGIEQPIHD
jgi:hypothetical protein